MLYLVATPIGNLEDISRRAVETLRLVDYILCEDTRHSQALLKRYEISKPLKSYHQFNEAARSDEVVADLESGKNLALISDSGTPCISDPGERLVARCKHSKIIVQSIPGPCALISALICSGLPTDRFQFIGFIPKKESIRKKMLLDAIIYPGTTVAYESPKRMLETLKEIAKIKPEAQVSVARELTKIHEEVVTRSAAKQLEFWEAHQNIKGEIVIMISGNHSQSREQWAALSPEKHVSYLMNDYGLSKKEAIKLAAEMRGVPKRDVYIHTI